MDEELNNQSTVGSSLTGWFSGLVKSASAAYAANRQAAAATQQAKATNASATASILNSRNMIIAAVVLIGGVALFMFIRRK